MADLQELTITFAGICTHFYNVVPGVPMRTVLPDASAARFGVLRMPANDPSDPDVMISYLLMPHVPLFNDGSKVTVIAGAGLRILNAVGDRPQRPDSGFLITDYVHNFAYSENVVLNGSAAGYFDISAAKSVTTAVSPSGTRTTVVVIKTEGTPLLQITPFPGSLMKDELQRPIGSGQLWVTNNDYDPQVADINFDFVLSYLVARGGIPKQLKVRTPGLPPNPTLLTSAGVGTLFQSLGGFILAGGALTNEQLRSHANNPVSLNESCSDSHYP